MRSRTLVDMRQHFTTRVVVTQKGFKLAKQSQELTSESAKNYVKRGIFEKGGFNEGFGGVINKTLPNIFNSAKDITLTSTLRGLSRAIVLIMTALFPLLSRKVWMGGASAATPSIPITVSDGMDVIVEAIKGAGPLDYILGLVALALLAVPKLLDLFGPRSSLEHHSPFYSLSAALRKLPLPAKLTSGNTEEVIRLTLHALREEMALLIGESTNKRVTDVVLLEFCDATCKRMQVRQRTASHEETKRPVDSTKFVAYYVAMEGRSFAEHDFKNKSNPFPAKRITVLGNHDVDYRSVLYMPIMWSEKVTENGDRKTIDSCIGVICVHSSKPYRFWRWGDHKKSQGRFADVAFSRSMPYIAIIEQLLSRAAAPQLRLEAQ